MTARTLLSGAITLLLPDGNDSGVEPLSTSELAEHGADDPAVFLNLCREYPCILGDRR